MAGGGYSIATVQVSARFDGYQNHLEGDYILVMFENEIWLIVPGQCPAQAANGMLWSIKIHRDHFFNAFKCREKCGELAKQRLNVDEHICGLCVSVCPIGKK